MRMTRGGTLFPGQYFDAESGLHYNYFRDYDPKTGRYVEPDPIGLIGGMNLYTYVSNSPLKFIDSSGLAPIGDVTFGYPSGSAGIGVGAYYGGGAEGAFSVSECCENGTLYKFKVLTFCGGLGIGAKGTLPISVPVASISSRSGCPSTRYYVKHENSFVARSVNVQTDKKGSSAGVDVGAFGIGTAWSFCSDTVISKIKVGCCNN